MVRHAARMITEKEEGYTMYCAMAKAFGTEACYKLVNDGLQMFGGYGYLQDY